MTGQEIGSKRRALGISQETLGRRVGVTWGTVNRWERGESTPQPDHLAKLERELTPAMPVDEFQRLLKTLAYGGLGDDLNAAYCMLSDAYTHLYAQRKTIPRG